MKKLKVFKFKQNCVVDLTSCLEHGYDVIQCGKDKYTLKDFKLQDGHDDSLPYSAVLCLNDKPLCKCTNDGWGGQTDLTALDIQSKAIMASVAVKLMKFGWLYRRTEFVLKLNFIADTLATSAYFKNC